MKGKHRVCVVPFQRFEAFTGPGPGDAPVFLCCGGWLKLPAGDLRRQSPEEIWNGARAQEIRRSILDGSFRHCDRAQCPFLESQTGPVQFPEEIGDPEAKAAILGGRTKLPYGPKDINCGYDKSCNLSCPSCRADVIVQSPHDEPLGELHRKLEAGVLPGAEKITITGSGDPFGSPFFRRWLRTMDIAAMPRLKSIHLQTNGQLWTPEMWVSLPPSVRAKIRTAEVSIDAAEPETYAANRRGGRFDRLLESLAFIASLRRSGELEWLKFNMVVQENNFAEMPAFVRLGRRFEVDGVYFSRMTNWGTWPDEEFRRRAVFLEEHPRHREFLGVLQDEIFADPRVTLGNLAVFRHRALKRRRWDHFSQEKEWYLSTLEARRFRLGFLLDPRFVARRLMETRSPAELARRAAGVARCLAYGVQNGLYAARGWGWRAGRRAKEALRLAADAGLKWTYGLQKRLYGRQRRAARSQDSAGGWSQGILDFGIRSTYALQNGFYRLRPWTIRDGASRCGNRRSGSAWVSPPGRRLFCERPFVWFEAGNGPGPTDVPVSLCCPTWLKKPTGDLRFHGVERTWNGPEAQEIRRSILDGSFRFCDRALCPFLKNESGPVRPPEEVTDPVLRRVIDEGLTVLPYGPPEVHCDFDRSCNLSCPSCRTEVIVERAENQSLHVIRRKLEREALPQARSMYISGSGDGLASPFFRGWLETLDVGSMPRLEAIFLQTNGQLWTPQLWRKLPAAVRAKIRSAEVSIDAATAATYAVNRRGGDFERLLENLEYIASLRRSGPLEWLKISMVVQENNFREMPEFIRLGRRLGLDEIYFSRLVNWGTFSPEEYRRRAVHLPGHPRHRDLLEVLQDCTFADPAVFLGNMADLRDRGADDLEPTAARAGLP